MLPTIPEIPLHPRAACTLLRSLSPSHLRQAQQLHAHTTISGDSLRHPLLVNHLISFYSRSGHPFLSSLVFSSALTKTHISYTSLASAFASNGLPHLSLSLFRTIHSLHLPLDDRALPIFAKACASAADERLGRCVHSLACRTGFSSNVFVGSSLVDMYAKSGHLFDARRLFDEMPVRNVVSWGGLIHGYSLSGETEMGLRLFREAVRDRDVGVNDFTLSCVAQMCGVDTLLELGAQTHALCLKTGFGSSSFVGSSFVSLYSRCGSVEDARRAFAGIGFKNLGAWNSMMVAFAVHGRTESAFGLFRSMGKAGVRPNFITFLSLLSACSHAGLVEEGKRYFAMMGDHGIEPGPQHYACMVDLLSRAGRLSEAVEFIKNMPIEPPESAWGALLTGCRIHKDTKTAAFVAERLLALNSHASGLHMLLTNAYAATGMYEEAAKARKAMRDRGVKKETGLSWIEFDSCVHTFVSGDRSHPLSGEIYKKLDELGEELERLGYVDTSVVLRDLGGEEKRRVAAHHSERLAVAFGLISFPADRPIRVMKNIRVCGDCHTVFKFMSKCTGRTIILRDNNRFHHFVDGSCSCGDYW